MFDAFVVPGVAPSVAGLELDEVVAGSPATADEIVDGTGTVAPATRLGTEGDAFERFEAVFGRLGFARLAPCGVAGAGDGDGVDAATPWKACVAAPAGPDDLGTAGAPLAAREGADPPRCEGRLAILLGAVKVWLPLRKLARVGPLVRNQNACAKPGRTEVQAFVWFASNVTQVDGSRGDAGWSMNRRCPCERFLPARSRRARKV